MRPEPAVDMMRRRMSGAESLPYRPVLRADPCVYCCAWFHPGFGHGVMTLEHIQPRADRGGDSWRNLAVAHESCNRHRGRSPLLVYLLYRQRLIALQGPKHRKARDRVKKEMGAMRHPVR